jgi:hypothetical protein
MRDCRVKQFLQVSCNWVVVPYVGGVGIAREGGVELLLSCKSDGAGRCQPSGGDWVPARRSLGWEELRRRKPTAQGKTLPTAQEFSSQDARPG